MLLGLVGSHHCFLRHLRLHVLNWGSHGGVVGAELVVRHRWAGVDGGRVGGWAQFFVLQHKRRLHVEEFGASIIESTVWGHCGKQRRRQGKIENAPFPPFSEPILTQW